MQSTNSIFMIRPSAFGFDEETATSNAFQQRTEQSVDEVREAAMNEFAGLTRVLRTAGVGVMTLDDHGASPNAVFPNNWVTTHPDGTVVLYPMATPGRRAERRKEVLDELERFFDVKSVIDLSHYEEKGQFLEGTGSLVFDRLNGRIFACRAARTHEVVLKDLADQLGYEYILFDAEDANGVSIYHTNVMMCVGTGFATIADFTIRDADERFRVLEALEGSDRHLLKLRPDQLAQFAGNMLELSGRGRVVAMSTRAFESLSPSQRDFLSLYALPVHAPVTTIEKLGGGSVRCMIAEIFLPPK